MVNRLIGRLALATSLLVASPIVYGVPVLQSISPLAISYAYGVGADFTVGTPTGFGDVTAALWAVDLLIPSPGGSTSGCDVADFAGFAAGSIALIQRGTCTFETKAFNAAAAGAVGVLLFNEGNTLGRMDAIGVALGTFALTPVFFASYGVGSSLANGQVNGNTGYIVRMKVAPGDVPEPGTLALLGLGLAGLGLSRRRKAA